MAKRFNPPPGWPVPRDGSAPPAGWSPDPSWPSPPPGWKLWLDDEVPPTTQKPRMGRTPLVLGLIVVVLLALVGGIAYVEKRGREDQVYRPFGPESSFVGSSAAMVRELSNLVGCESVKFWDHDQIRDTASCDTRYGHVSLYAYYDRGKIPEFLKTLTLVCGVKGVTPVVFQGKDWLILPPSLSGDENIRSLGKAIGAESTDFCAGQSPTAALATPDVSSAASDSSTSESPDGGTWPTESSASSSVPSSTSASISCSDLKVSATYRLGSLKSSVDDEVTYWPIVTVKNAGASKVSVLVGGEGRTIDPERPADLDTPTQWEYLSGSSAEVAAGSTSTIQTGGQYDGMHVFPGLGQKVGKITVTLQVTPDGSSSSCPAFDVAKG